MDVEYSQEERDNLDAAMEGYIALRDRPQILKNLAWRSYKKTASVIMHHTEEMKSPDCGMWRLSALKNVCEHLKSIQQKYNNI
jgi:hypothetical protein